MPNLIVNWIALRRRHMDTLTETREALATRQADLVSSLMRRASAPPGFDRERLHAAADLLARKRSRAVIRAWPHLARGLGDRFDPLFARFAAEVGMVKNGGALADGRAFARHMDALGELPPEGRLQARLIDLQFSSSADGLKPRKGPALRIHVYTKPFRIFVGVHLPWFGVRWHMMRLFAWR